MGEMLGEAGYRCSEIM